MMNTWWNIGDYMAMCVSLIFLVLPSLMLLVTFAAKIFTCLCCICVEESSSRELRRSLNCTTGDPDTLLPTRTA